MNANFSFNNPEAKAQFIRTMQRMERNAQLIKDEGHNCGDCAAFPCFRHTPADYTAGLCFQSVKQCRQECSHYKYPEFPARGGVCDLDGQRVKYDQECHIESEKKSKL
jgi:hypothetical protein